MNCGCRWKWRMFIAVNLSNWKEEAWKKSGLQRDSNPWPPRIPLRCSTNWTMKPHIGSEVNLLSSYLQWGVKWCKVYMNWPLWGDHTSLSQLINTEFIFGFRNFFLRNTACRHGHELYTDHSFNLILTTAHPCEIHAGGKQLKDIKLQKKSKSGRQEGLLQALHAYNVRCADVLNNLKWKNPWSQALPYKGYPYV